jgi:serine protease AprX
MRLFSLLTLRLALVLACALGVAAPGLAGPKAGHPKLDAALKARAQAPHGSSRVIVEMQDGAPASPVIQEVRGTRGRRLLSFPGHVALVDDSALEALASHPHVKRVYHDRPVVGTLNRTIETIMSGTVRALSGFDGAGVGVAVIDSGITGWHDDLTPGSTYDGYVTGSQRVVRFVDFVNQRLQSYDDFGHGTHVAGIIAGNGYSSGGAHAGVAPGAHLVDLKVLDGNGFGHMSNVIAAIDYALQHREAYNIRIINLSVGAAVTMSYRDDPLALAAKAAVDAGMVVVVAAGNLGRNREGQPQYGAITAPGNAPWVLTVGASSHQGTADRRDDVMASFSSRGPTAVDFAAKPDLVAPGTGTVSLSDPHSLFYSTKSHLLIEGSAATADKPYLSLSGTSMAAPVVSGTVALMLQANPRLTPNAVKAILQYTAEHYPGYNFLTQGAGFLNARGAVTLARFFATARLGENFPWSPSWSRHILWGNHRLRGGIMLPGGNAWATSTVWGADRGADGDNIVWGTLCGLHCDNVVWGTSTDGDNIVWGTFGDGDNIVWGTFGDGDNIVWGTFGGGDNIVWGTFGDSDNIVWGTDCGGADCDNIVWGTAREGDGDSIVWGTAGGDDNIVWGTFGGDDNIVWGTFGDGDNIVWGTSDGDDNVVWGTSSPEGVRWHGGVQLTEENWYRIYWDMFQPLRAVEGTDATDTAVIEVEDTSTLPADDSTAPENEESTGQSEGLSSQPEPPTEHTEEPELPAEEPELPVEEAVLPAEEPTLQIAEPVLTASDGLGGV